jgi:hypothetical protein
MGIRSEVPYLPNAARSTHSKSLQQREVIERSDMPSRARIARSITTITPAPIRGFLLKASKHRQRESFGFGHAYQVSGNAEQSPPAPGALLTLPENAPSVLNWSYLSSPIRKTPALEFLVVFAESLDAITVKSLLKKRERRDANSCPGRSNC